MQFRLSVNHAWKSILVQRFVWDTCRRFCGEVCGTPSWGAMLVSRVCFCSSDSFDIINNIKISRHLGMGAILDISKIESSLPEPTSLFSLRQMIPFDINIKEVVKIKYNSPSWSGSHFGLIKN